MSFSLFANPRRSFWTLGLIVVLGLFLLALVLRQSLTRPASSLSSDTPILQQSTAIAAPYKDSIFAVPSGDIVVYVPAEALEQVGIFTLTPREPNIFPDVLAEADWDRSRVVNIEFSDIENNLVPDPQFSPPIDVCFQLSFFQWEYYLESPDNVRVQVFNDGENNSGWEDLPLTSRTDSFQVCGQLTHLSLVALAIKELPKPPDPVPVGPYIP